MNCFQLGMRLTFTGLTSPPTMRRRLASPEADTRSYWPPPPPPPVCMSATISFDEPASLRWILQPVVFSKRFAKLGSEYAGHSIRFSRPSPLPIFVWSPLVDPELTPDAGTHSTAATAAPRTCTLRILLILRLPVRFRRGARAATRGAPASPWTRAPPARRSRGSA